MKIDVIELAKKAGIATGGHPMIPWSVYTTTLESLLALHRQALIDSGELVPREKVEADKRDYGGLWDLSEAKENVRQLTSVLSRILEANKEHCMECGIQDTESWVEAEKILCDRARSQP